MRETKRQKTKNVLILRRKGLHFPTIPNHLHPLIIRQNIPLILIRRVTTYLRLYVLLIPPLALIPSPLKETFCLRDPKVLPTVLCLLATFCLRHPQASASDSSLSNSDASFHTTPNLASLSHSETHACVTWR